MSLFADDALQAPSAGKRSKLRARKTAQSSTLHSQPHSKEASIFDEDNHDSDDDSDDGGSGIGQERTSSLKKPNKAKQHHSTAKDKASKSWWLDNQRRTVPIMLTLLSAMTRFYRISFSNFVVWDEAHFGKFGAYYVNHTFYHDVHPPLAKMLVGFSEILTGFDGSFTFSSGKQYPEDVNYAFMRVFNASFGVALAPLAYFTMLNLGFSANAALLSGLMICFDNALCTISRFILLDAMLLCFTAMSAWTLSGLYKHRNRPFTKAWYKWLFGTGVSLGLVTSSKWVGFLSVALVGLYTVCELYDIFGAPNLRAKPYAMHWISRAAALIVVPFTIYLLCFKIHFAVLYKSGPGDAEMDSLFQANLEGSTLKDQPLDVAFGSLVTLKSSVQGIGLLHSHQDTYPEGSKQQQITCYGHKDQNNDWIIKKAHGQTYGNTTDTVEFLKNGDIVRLVHERTNRNLHSHPVDAPISKREWETTCYGLGDKYRDPNDHWRVEVVNEASKNNPEHRIRTLTTRFRLRHVMHGCALRVTGKRLPKWAWNQAEVVCDRHNNLDEGTLWNIELHTNPLLPKAKPSDLNSPFFRSFWSLNAAMARTNNALVPDKDKFDALTSSPYEWPLMIRGLRICGWSDQKVKYWLTGNPVVWWLSTLSMALGPIQLIYYMVRRQRGLHDFVSTAEWQRYIHIMGILWGGWALHYFPFFIMGRVTYLHHYFPALYFAAMHLVFFIDWNIQRITGAASSKVSKIVLLVLGIATIANFMFFAPFTFGFNYPAKELANRKWLSSWNIYDP